MARQRSKKIPTKATVKGAEEIREEEEARVDTPDDSSQINRRSTAEEVLNLRAPNGHLKPIEDKKGDAALDGDEAEEEKAGEDLGSSVRPAKEVYAGIRYSFAKEYLDEKRREFLESKDKEFEEIAIKVKAGEKANDGDKLREGEVPPENTAQKVEIFQQEENLTKLDLEELKKRISSLDNDIKELELEIEELKRTKEKIESELSSQPKKKSQSKPTIGDLAGVIEEEYKNNLNETKREINKKEGVLSEKKKEKEEIRAEVERRTKTKSADEKGKKTSDIPDMIVREEEKHPADAGATKPQSSNRGIKVEKTGEEEGKSSATASGVPTPSDGFVSEIFEKIKAGIRELSVEELRELSVDELSKIKLRLEKRIRELANKNKTLPKEKIEGKGKIKEPEKGEIENNRGEQDSKQKPNKIEETDQETRNNREELEKLNIAHMAISNILLEKYKTQETQEKREEAARALGIDDPEIRKQQIENIIFGGLGPTVGENAEGSDKKATEPPVREEGESPVPTEPPVLGGKNSASGILSKRVASEGLEPKDGTSEGLKPKDGTSEGLKPKDGTSEGLKPKDGTSEGLKPKTDSPKEPDAEKSKVGGNKTGENTTGDEESDRTANADKQPSGTSETPDMIVREEEKHPADASATKPPIQEKGESPVPTEPPVLGGENSASRILRKRVEREGLEPKDGTPVDEAAAGGSDSGADERTPKTDSPKEPDAEKSKAGGNKTGEKVTGDEEKAETEKPAKKTETEKPAKKTETEKPAKKTETEKPAKKTEAEKLYDKDCALLEEKEGVLKKWQDVQKTWQARYDAATRKVRDRSKRARYSYEILRAEAQITRASIEEERLKEIVGVSAKMVDAEKQFGKDSEQYIKAKNERERLYKLYQGYIDEVGEVQGVDRNRKGIIKGGDGNGQDRLNVKPAKPSKLKAFWNKIKKPFVAFVIVSVLGAGITGLALGINNSGKEKVDDPNTNTPIEQPVEQPDDDSKDNELVDEIDKNFDTGSLTDEDKQQIEDKLEEVGSITSMVKVEGVEGVSYRKDGDVDKVNIYITTQAGSIIEYQTQVTKDEISEFATTEGVTAKDIVDLILSDVSKNTPSASYKKIDEAKYGQLINNIRSDAEDIEFPDPGKYGNYTSFYFKIDNTRNEKGEDVGNVDFLAIGPDSVVKVDDRVECQTSTGEKLDLRDPSALLNMIERSLGGNASTSGFSGEIETKFNSTSYFQTHKDENSQVEEKDENSQVEEAEAIQNIMNEAVAKTEKELFNDELTR